ncbi:c-type cytochrome [Ideonella azotifigens]|uniref:Cytochrome c domain-containing protein n=1 Tax=Ideonella azotifigens TaxID=513160 RepID=A0ABP3VBR6_9BURK|nr:c-type cytochrome [Ideonella azotifigens]MCD2342606.1 c-type cytochrome [Ideonella azotifigens]
MTRRARLLLLLATLLAAGPAAARDGQALFAERCQACHTVQDAPAAERWRVAFTQQGPSLAGAGSKFNPAWLVAWLQQPGSLHGGSYPYFRWVQRTPEGDRLPTRAFEHLALNAEEAQAAATYLGTLQAELQAFPPQPALAANTTRVLYDKVAACSGCHSPDAAAPRTGPLLSNAGQRLNPAWVDAFLHDPQQLGTVNMPKARLRMDQVAALAQYVLNPPPAEPASPAQAPAAGTPPKALDASAPRGALVYRVVCSQCHGVDGDGRGINARFLSVEPRNHRGPEMDKLGDEHLYRVIRYGGTAVDKSALMPSWASVLNDAEIQDVIAYLKTLRQRTD